MLSNYSRIILMTVFGLCANVLVAQSSPEVCQPNSDKYDQFIEEVYGEYADELVFSKPLRYKSIKKMLNERIEYQEVTPEMNEKIQTLEKLSDYSLNKTYVENLTRNPSVSMSDFNPLKYNIDLYRLEQNQYILSENNEFIIIIKAQNIN